MHNVRFTSLLALCAALAACSDSNTNRGIATPDKAPAFDVAPAADGALIDLATGAAVVFTADDVDATQAATGGRASGHADITVSSIQEQYSFIALSTNPSPTAKGEVQGKATSGGTTVLELHANADCLVTIGNQAWVSGPIERLNGQPTTLHVLFRVMDRGEGANDPPDLASQLFGTGPQGCSSRPNLPLFSSGKGNIQVQPR
jgi:hypothetical protein